MLIALSTRFNLIMLMQVLILRESTEAIQNNEQGVLPK